MLHAVEVLPAFRRTGVAKKLMAQAAKWAEDHGARYMALMTTRDNTAANRLYSSLGMRPVGQYHYRIKDTSMTEFPHRFEPAHGLAFARGDAKIF